MAHDRSAPPGPNPSNDQSETIAFLADPQTHGSLPVDRIDTHLSHVFLTPGDVYKLKRATRFDFADYSTLQKRKAYCEQELDANRSWSNSLYHGVLPVRRDEHGLNLNGDTGEIVDWLVHMRRFPDDARMDRRLSAGLVTRKDLTGFADALSNHHDRTAPDQIHGGAEAMSRLIDQVVSGLLEHAPCAAPVEDINRLQATFHHASDTRARQLDTRRAQGKVKRCHGDLHLKNICYWQGELIGFDALEFDDDMRTIDVLYDLAFPVMDLIHAGHRDAASLVMNRYLARTGDYNGLGLFDLYLGVRASVCAMAASIRGDKGNAQAYFSTAQMLIKDRSTPGLIAIGGRSGTGKSTIAAALAPDLGSPPGAIILRSDVLRKSMAGVRPEQRLSEHAYRAQNTADVYRHMRDAARDVVTAGYSCILDATFLDLDERHSIDQLADDLGLAPVRLWLDAPTETLRDRITKRGPDASDATLSVLETQLKARTPGDWRIIDASGSIAETRRNALATIRESRRCQSS